MKRLHTKSHDCTDLPADEGPTKSDEEAIEDVNEDTLFETPVPPGSKEYIDLELARINPIV